MSDEPETRRDRLEQLLARLPPEVKPARDLWPGIERALEPRTRRPWLQPQRLAAAVAVAAIGSFALWRALPPAPAPAAQAWQPSFEAPQDPDFRATRAALEHTYAERLQLLNPATRLRIERNLQIIRRANADIRRALADDPSSPALQRLLDSTWQQEIDLYATVGRATEPALRRTRT